MKIRLKHWVPGALSLVLLTACEQSVTVEDATETQKSGTITGAPLPELDSPTIERRAWFGETHVHTGYSVDASILNVTSTPDDAYRYAKGEEIQGIGELRIQSSRPIDFMAVTDHAEYLGVIRLMSDPTHPLSQLPLSKQMVSSDKDVVAAAFAAIGESLMTGEAITDLQQAEVIGTSWRTVVDIADQHYQPGEFTTFAAFEWSSHPDASNLHRNVIFAGGKGKVPELPFSSLTSPRPEDLWEYMEAARKEGNKVLAIPHNSNLSNGRMFPTTADSFGNPLDAEYARRRNHNEPLVEISQIKGTSETHPSLSPNDEWAGFEILDEMISHSSDPAGVTGKLSGSYVREAYLNGLLMQEREKFNPYQFGIIAATDSHNASVPSDENNYTGKIGLADNSPELRREGRVAGMPLRKFSASGLAGVWAEQNTREAIFAAMSRKETFGTSGPRISLRFFAGSGFPEGILGQPDWAVEAYRRGVPMGSSIAAGTMPEFLIAAQQDPEDAPLQRLQVVKGLVSGGKAYEKVFDVACAGGASPDRDSHRCPEVSAPVNLEDCSYPQDAGSVQLAAHWRDPEFKPGEAAFYYARVIQNPTCRWTTWDALRLGQPLLEDVPAVIQERAWSSPIWVAETSPGTEE